MKKLVLSGLALIVLMSINNESVGQNKEIQNTQLYKLFQMKYVFGMKYNDGEVAKDALYSMIAMDPNDDSLKMSLCYYYFDQNQFASSLFVSRDLLARYPDNIDALKINAMSLENMGARDKAVDAYETLYLKSNDIGILYQVALLQFEMERYAECGTNLDIIIKNPQAKTLKLSFNKSDREQQEVSLEAACYNMKGMLENQQGNKEEAKKNLQKAIELEPEFTLASQNLADIK
jgi:tetratricopeptide (TPR) repeat protein